MDNYPIIRCENQRCREDTHELMAEEPLLIRVDGSPYSVVMRTPGDEIPHAAGFCLGEGLVDRMADFASVGFCKDLDPNVVEVRLKPERREKVPEILQRRGFISQTSCGICGKELIADLFQDISPITSDIRVGLAHIFQCTALLEKTQVYYDRTRGAHAAMVVDASLNALSFAEDVGRHNALDKAIGKLLIGGALNQAVMAVLTSRISYELVQKSARARLPILVGKSRPTALAVDMGTTLNMTLACSPRKSEVIVFCGEARIRRDVP